MDKMKTLIRIILVFIIMFPIPCMAIGEHLQVYYGWFKDTDRDELQATFISFLGNIGLLGTYRFSYSYNDYLERFSKGAFEGFTSSHINNFSVALDYPIVRYLKLQGSFYRLESNDYGANTYSLGVTLELNNKNTGLTLKYTRMDTNLYTTFDRIPGRRLGDVLDRDWLFAQGLTFGYMQVLSTRFFFNISFTGATQTDQPDAYAAALQLRKYFDTRTAIHLDYRYFNNMEDYFEMGTQRYKFEVDSNALDLKVLQYLGDYTMLTARYRLYEENKVEGAQTVTGLKKGGDSQMYGVKVSRDIIPGLLEHLFSQSGAFDKINLHLKYDHYFNEQGFCCDSYLLGFDFSFL